MKKVAKFEKVSFEQFLEGCKDCYPDMTEAIGELDFTKYCKVYYDAIKIPRRATTGSAGYDFYTPVGFILKPGETIKIPTGIRCKIDEGWVLKIYPRSGLGFKYRLGLDNTVGVIDSDYYFSDNEGHIFAKITNNSKEGKEINLESGKAFMQGVFVEYGITYDDNTEGVRNGGFGSTSN